jgi:methanethiol S-methyltransferase
MITGIANPYGICGGLAMRRAVSARSLPHFAPAKIKTFSRTNQAGLKDPGRRGRQSCRSENPAPIRAAMQRRHRTQKQFAGVPYQGECIMGRIIGFLFGLLAYAIFFGTFLYAVGFVSGVAVPKTIDSGPVAPVAQALIINILLLSLFAVQHSVMARKPFKRWWTRFIPATIERSTYVLLASLVLILLFWLWHPMPQIVWEITNPRIAAAVMGVSFAGWLLVLVSTFLINHFELFGLHQVAINLAGRTMPAPRFKTPVLYKLVRHPIYLGFIVAFWAAPVMTVGHLLFAAVTTAYIFVGIFLEERDLIQLFGEEYKRYRAQVGMLIPFRRKLS